MMPAQDSAIGAFPAAVQGWTLAPGGEAYSPEDLHRYIDGASELYISYGFKRLSTRRYERPGWPEITVDLFDMGSPGNAFGIFAHGQESPDRQIGMDSEYLDGLLRFWQGQQYVSLLCSPETPESRTAVMELGRRIAQSLPRAGDRPEALALLPESGLLASSIRYFRHHAWQNAYRFIANENILGLGPDSVAVLAKYDLGMPRPLVLLALYPDAGAAGRAFAGLRGLFHLPVGEGAVVQLADGAFFTACTRDRLIAAIWHPGGADPARGLLSALLEKAAAR